MSSQDLLLCNLAPGRTGSLQDPALSQALGEVSSSMSSVSILALLAKSSWNEQPKGYCCVQMLGWSNVSLVLVSPKEGHFFRAQFWHHLGSLPVQENMERPRNMDLPAHPRVSAKLLSVQDKSFWGGKSPWASRHQP